MILTSYILASTEPLKLRYIRLKDAPFVPASEMKEHILTLDILEKDAVFHVLLSQPDWDSGGLTNNVENICSSLLMLMDLCGFAKERDKVHWYELSWFSYPELRLHRAEFKDDGKFLSNPGWQDVDLKDSPFNFSGLIPSLKK